MAVRQTETHDPDWLNRLQNRDHAAFTELVQQYHPMVFLCCRTLGLQDAEAQDVASETFMTAWRQIPKFRRDAKVSTWLWSIAFRRGISCLRSRRNRISLSQIPDALPAEDGRHNPADGLEKGELAESVWRAVEKLPPLWAVAVVLFYREDKTIVEIAQIMNTPKNTVKTYLFRARKHLKELLIRHLDKNHVAQPIKL